MGAGWGATALVAVCLAARPPRIPDPALVAASPERSSAPTVASPWADVFATPAPIILAFGAPQFFTSDDGLLVRDIHVNDPTPANARRLRTFERTLRAPLRPTEIYTGIGETNGAVALTRFITGQGHALRVMRSRHLGWDDLKDAHVVFLASMRFRTLADELAVPEAFTLDPDHAPPGHDLAIVTAWPGKTPGRRVLVLRGRTTWATQGAAEYVTRPEHLHDLAGHLDACRARRGLPSHPANYQVHGDRAGGLDGDGSGR